MMLPSLTQSILEGFMDVIMTALYEASAHARHFTRTISNA